MLSGPSGVGKSTVADIVLADSRIARVVTATTRAPRPGERDGADYRFQVRTAAGERTISMTSDGFARLDTRAAAG